jgi:hypothetical protein
MFDKVLPERIDNTYRGHKLALWILAVVVAVKIMQSLGVIFNADSVVRSADGIPLDTFTSAGAQTVLAIWSLSAFDRLIISLLCLLALLRYRSLVPFMFGLLSVHYLLRELILHYTPLVRTGTPPGPAVNFSLFVLGLVGLALSLWRRRARSAT